MKRSGFYGKAVGCIGEKGKKRIAEAVKGSLNRKKSSLKWRCVAWRVHTFHADCQQTEGEGSKMLRAVCTDKYWRGYNQWKGDKKSWRARKQQKTKEKEYKQHSAQKNKEFQKVSSSETISFSQWNQKFRWEKLFWNCATKKITARYLHRPRAVQTTNTNTTKQSFF